MNWGPKLPKRFPADLPTEYQRWRSEYLGLWTDRPGYWQLRELAEYYVDVTETFDERVCTGCTERGTAIPMTQWERSESTAFARQQKEELGWLACQLGFTATEWTEEVRRAIERYGRNERELYRRSR